ncbi:hypothetical protein Pan216_25250 [Planctomycetes bacterium Pan216]|uniref:Uncharacterized protein n=1 Tax=Kolteria novifilia TaxID=2527975 RepID=A0A518B3Z3_9BACT|nr:hypothetical protein Pan216_25250 [Planctomycetes bacterium Pan216]
MIEDALKSFATLRENVPKLLEALSRGSLRGGSLDPSTRKELQAALQEALHDKLPNLEASFRELLDKDKDADAILADGNQRLNEALKRFEETQDAEAAAKGPDIADHVSRRNTLIKELMALSEPSLFWWAVVSLASLRESEVLDLQRSDRIAVALAALWVATPSRTHPRVVEPRLAKRLTSRPAHSLFPALAMTGLDVPSSLNFSPISFVMRLVTHYVDQTNGPEILPHYDRAIRLAQGIRQGHLGWVDRTGHIDEHDGFSTWLEVEKLEKRVESMPEVSLQQRGDFHIDGWPLEKIDDVLHQCFEDLSGVRSDSEDVIDIIAVQFLRKLPEPAPAPVPRPEAPPMVQDWAMGGSSISCTSLALSQQMEFDSLRNSTIAARTETPMDDASPPRGSGGSRTPGNAIHDWTWLLSNDENATPSSKHASGEGEN